MMVLGTLCLVLGAAAADGDGIVAKGSLVVGSGVVSAILTYLGMKKHAEKTAIPQPCKMQQVNDCVSVKECNRRMAALDDRVTRLETEMHNGFDKIEDKLEAMDQKSEARSVALHNRLDKIFERMAK